MMNAEEIFKCLSSKKESDLIFTKHFIDRYHERINVHVQRPSAVNLI